MLLGADPTQPSTAAEFKQLVELAPYVVGVIHAKRAAWLKSQGYAVTRPNMMDLDLPSKRGQAAHRRPTGTYDTGELYVPHPPQDRREYGTYKMRTKPSPAGPRLSPPPQLFRGSRLRTCSERLLTSITNRA
jgi:hypothetical protein